jgi:hypothetical protein
MRAACVPLLRLRLEVEHTVLAETRFQRAQGRGMGLADRDRHAPRPQRMAA